MIPSPWHASLQASRRELADRDVRREVIELRAGAGIVVCAQDDGDGGAVEMEEGVNAARPGDDGHGAAGFEQLTQRVDR